MAHYSLRTAPLLLAALVLSACGTPDNDNALAGYMEARLVLVGPDEGGRLTTLAVREGDAVEVGAPLFRLDDELYRDRVTETEARLAEARAQLADAKAQSQRPEEVAVLEAARRDAAAAVEQATREVARVRRLFQRGAVPRAELDDALTALERRQAALTETQRRITAAQLPARRARIGAAEAAVTQARAQLAMAQLERRRRLVEAPAAGTVEEVLSRPGEMVGTGQAVLALLPSDQLRIRFFVPETRRAGLQVGERVMVACDGCPADLTGEIIFLAREAEFTPPNLLTRDQRHRLVYRVEARPLGATAALTAGQPVTITPTGNPR